MSDEPQLTNQDLGRTLRIEERKLIEALLSGCNQERALREMAAGCRVKNMQDGGMGGIRFVTDKQQQLGTVLAEAEYFDEDGVLVSIVINADQAGALFELDFWRVDFGPLKKYPSPSDVSIKT